MKSFTVQDFQNKPIVRFRIPSRTRKSETWVLTYDIVLEDMRYREWPGQLRMIDFQANNKEEALQFALRHLQRVYRKRGRFEVMGIMLSRFPNAGGYDRVHVVKREFRSGPADGNFTAISDPHQCFEEKQ